MNDQRMDISVVIPLYNKRETVERAINSVLVQSYHPREIIVINDGSTDGSEKIVEKLDNPLIKLIHQENAGVSAARNKGIDEARYDWIAFLDADDEWLPDYLFKINEMQDLYHADILATSYYLRKDKKNDKIILNNIQFDGDCGIMSNYFEVAATSNPPICSSAVVVNKECLKEVSGFPLGVKSGEDLLTWAKLASKYKIAYNLIPLAIFYLEDSQIYEDKPKRVPEAHDPVYLGLLDIYDQNNDIYGLKKYIAHWKLMRANIFIRLGQNWKSVKETITAMKFHPFKLKVYVFLMIAILPVRDKGKLFKFFSKQ